MTKNTDRAQPTCQSASLLGFPAKASRAADLRAGKEHATISRDFNTNMAQRLSSRYGLDRSLVRKTNLREQL